MSTQIEVCGSMCRKRTILMVPLCNLADMASFELRYWGPTIASQKAKLRKGGSITLTIGKSRLCHNPFNLYSRHIAGTALFRPPAGGSFLIGTVGAVDALARGLAVDLAPIRVNTVCPGYVKTEVRET